MPALTLAPRRAVQLACALATHHMRPCRGLSAAAAAGAAGGGGGRPQRVGVVGSGAVGTYFGTRLAEMGHDVSFVVRSRTEEVPKRFEVHSASGSFALEAPRVYASARDLAQDGPLDWVLVCVKSTAMTEKDPTRWLEDHVAPCVTTPAGASSPTRVQFLMNGLGAEECAAALLGGARVHGGLVYGGFTRTRPGVVHHTGMPPEIRGGSFVDDPAELAAAETLWAGAGGVGQPTIHHVKYSPQPCLCFAQWSKLCWNIPFNGLTVLAGPDATVRDVWDHPPTRATAEGLVHEVVAVANADLDAHGAAPPYRFDVGATWGAIVPITQKMADVDYVPSTAADFRDGIPMEHEAIFAEPLGRAIAHCVPAPKLQAIAALISLLDKGRRRAPAASSS